jgi:cell division protein FtsL
MANSILDELQQAAELAKNSDASKIKNEAYDKKASHLKHKIIICLCFSGAFLVVMIAIIFHSQRMVTINEKDVSLLNAQIGDLNNKSANVEARISDAKKYKQIWIKADEKKKNFNGIKISDINGGFKALSDQFNLSNSSINISVPEILKDGVYSRQTLDVYLVNFVVNFDALTDKIAVDFINTFVESLPGHGIINDFSIKKNKKGGYSDADLINISSGKFSGLISAKVSFSWYFLKHKVATNQPKASDESKK